MKPSSLILYIILMLAMASCNMMPDVERPTDLPSLAHREGMYVLSEGLFNLNNSSLAFYLPTFSVSDADYFRTQNKRGLGDTANDMERYGNKLYIAVNVSSQIEVLDLYTGKSLKRIPLFDAQGIARQPRQLAFHEDKAYVTTFDGAVLRIDTTTLAVDAEVCVGRNPDGLCIANGKLYVANSGGLDYPYYDKTVSVIDLTTFTETVKIEVAINPTLVACDTEGDVYVLSQGNQDDILPCLQKINSQTDELVATYPIPARTLYIHRDMAYLYVADKDTQHAAIQLFDCATDRIVSKQFVTDGTTIQTPYAIQANPETDDIYITDAYAYTTWGDVLCFTSDGRLKYRINAVGLNPKKIVFVQNMNAPDHEEQPDPTPQPMRANRVLEYMPAPGQFINTPTSAYEPSFTYADVLRQANERLCGTASTSSILSLGAWGGYITLGFEQAIQNVPDTHDFRVLGNAFGNSAEPGIVQVAVDANANGLPDDPWYEIHGSEHTNALTVPNYEVTYYRPANPTDSIRWTDNRGAQGHVAYKSGHTHTYYPEWITDDSYTLRGTLLPQNAHNEGTDTAERWVFDVFDWGYADNQGNNSPASHMKIEWAVDSQGAPAQLDSIHFVRIYTGIQQNVGWLGETSTEINTVEALHQYK